MKSILVDSRISEELVRRLNVLGFNPILLPRSDKLGAAISSHPDSLIFKFGNTLFTSADYCDEAAFVFSDVRERHPNIMVEFTADVLGPRYPDDTRFNALLTRGELFVRRESISPAIIELAGRCGIRINPVRQGYPACSVLSLGDSAVTSDKGMAKAISEREIPVTLIREGHISLPPHEYGFIGGASFVFDGKVYFFGDYRLHPDGDAIEGAVLRAGLTPISLGTAPLADLGGGIVLE